MLREKSYRGRNPFFSIKESGVRPHAEIQRDIAPDVIGKMIREGRFDFRPVNIELQNQLSETEIKLHLNENQAYLISGFPRCLYQDDLDKTSRRTAFLE